MHFKNRQRGAEEMAQQLRALTVLPEDRGSYGDLQLLLLWGGNECLFLLFFLLFFKSGFLYTALADLP